MHFISLQPSRLQRTSFIFTHYMWIYMWNLNKDGKETHYLHRWTQLGAGERALSHWENKISPERADVTFQWGLYVMLSLNIDIYYLSEAQFRLSAGLHIDSALKTVRWSDRIKKNNPRFTASRWTTHLLDLSVTSHDLSHAISLTLLGRLKNVDAKRFFF